MTKVQHSIKFLEDLSKEVVLQRILSRCGKEADIAVIEGMLINNTNV
jgi:hypothetical protein